MCGSTIVARKPIPSYHRKSGLGCQGVFPGDSENAVSAFESIHWRSAKKSEFRLRYFSAIDPPVVAERGQWRTAPLQIAGRDIVEQQGGALEMPSGEALLDPRLPPQQPVEHVEHFVAADGTEAEQGTVAAGGGLRGQAVSGGELGAGLEHAGDYGGEGEVTPAAAGALQEALEAKLTADAEDGGDMAMGQGAADAEGLLAGAIDLAAAEHGADAVDDLGGQFGEVGEGGAADVLAVALGLAEEDGGGAVAVGDDVDVVGHGARPFTWKQHRTQSYCVSSINKDYYALRTWQQISSLQSGLWSGKPRYSNDLVDGARA